MYLSYETISCREVFVTIFRKPFHQRVVSNPIVTAIVFWLRCIAGKAESEHHPYKLTSKECCFICNSSFCSDSSFLRILRQRLNIFVALASLLSVAATFLFVCFFETSTCCLVSLLVLCLNAFLFRRVLLRVTIVIFLPIYCLVLLRLCSICRFDCPGVRSKTCLIVS